MEKVKVYAKNLDGKLQEQIEELSNREEYVNLRKAFMPDTHWSPNVPVGTVIELDEDDLMIDPEVVGADIGCGVSFINTYIDANLIKECDLKLLDDFIRNNIPTNRHDSLKQYLNNASGHIDEINTLLEQLRMPVCYDKVDMLLSLGTLGGGNHFIELAKDERNRVWVICHSGSRALGGIVCKYYKKLVPKAVDSVEIDSLIDELKSQGRHTEINQAIKDYKQNNPVNKRVLKGELAKDYLADQLITKEIAMLNRHIMVSSIVAYLRHLVLSYDIKGEQAIIHDSVHNYVDGDFILRKGATSSKRNELVAIPMNMRDGTLICYGKGNDVWLNSAPHGAGRLMSRTVARQTLTVEDFEQQMKNVFSTTVNKGTLDEHPHAYKPMDEILHQISDTVDLVDILTPIYNYKGVE